MGVQRTSKYPEIKALLSIPEDEPIFILRAQDAISTDALHLYFMLARYAGCETHFLGENTGGNEGLERVIREFEDWQDKNQGSVKVPD